MAVDRVMRTGWLRLTYLATLAVVVLGLLATGQAGAARQAAGRSVLGYYVPYDATSWASLAEHVDQLDVVAAQWVTIDACGNLASHDDQTLKQLARQHNVKVLPSLLTLSGWLNHKLLADDETAAHVVEQSESLLQGHLRDLEVRDPG